MKSCCTGTPESLNVGQNLLIASNLFRRRFDHEISKLTGDDSISGANTQIIGFLVAHQNQEIYQKDIEKAFSLRPSTVSANLRLMEKKGYVRREYSTVDTRLKQVIPTEKAIELNSLLHKKGYEIEEQFNAILNKEEQEIMKKMLRKLIRSLESED